MTTESKTVSRRGLFGIAGKSTLVAGIASSITAPFRSFVMDDYTRLMSGLFTLIDEVAFAPLKQRLVQRLLAESEPRGIAAVTHQKLADDVGSVREVVSRILAQWAEAGLIELRRGAIEIVDRASLAAAGRR